MAYSADTCLLKAQRPLCQGADQLARAGETWAELSRRGQISPSLTVPSFAARRSPALQASKVVWLLGGALLFRGVETEAQALEQGSLCLKPRSSSAVISLRGVPSQSLRFFICKMGRMVAPNLTALG